MHFCGPLLQSIDPDSVCMNAPLHIYSSCLTWTDKQTLKACFSWTFLYGFWEKLVSFTLQFKPGSCYILVCPSHQTWQDKRVWFHFRASFSHEKSVCLAFARCCKWTFRRNLIQISRHIWFFKVPVFLQLYSLWKYLHKVYIFLNPEHF